MKKAPEAFRTISEVADLLDTPQHILRFWETKFYQIRPVKRAGGRRYYRPDDVALLNGIRLLLSDPSQSIRGVQKLLLDHGHRHVQDLGANLPQSSVPRTEGADMALLADPIRPPGQRLAPPEPAPKPAAPVAVRVPVKVAPAADVALAEDEGDAPAPATPPRLPHLLRQLPRDALVAQRERAAGIARRIDALLDRMSEASGAGRW